MPLLKMDPTAAARNWHEIRPILERGLPPSVVPGVDLHANLLEAVIEGRIAIWVQWQPHGTEQVEVTGAVATTVVEDGCSGSRELLIYGLASLGGLITDESWRDGLRTLRAHAQAQRCPIISAYSNVQRIIDVAGALGADTSWRYLKFEV